MKKITLLLAVLVTTVTGIYAQVFNTSSTLHLGQFSTGIEPTLYINGGNDFNLFLHAGAGITSDIDFGVKLGIMGDNVYIGGDVEFSLNRYFSLAGGAHAYGDFGLDGTGLVTLPLGSAADIYSGLDMDIDFAGGEIQLPLWIPLGIEIPIKKYILFYFESEIRITNYGSHIIGAGVSFLF
jgi:hypothetical protein